MRALPLADPTGVVRRASRIVFRTPSWVWMITVLVLIFVKNGFWYAPGMGELVAIAQKWPHSAGLPAKFNYLLGSPVNFALPHWLGLVSRNRFIAFDFVVVGVFFVVLSVAARAKWGRFGLGATLLAFFATSSSNVTFTWVGLEDPYILMFVSTAFIFDSPLIALVSGFGLGLSNWQLGAFAFVSICLLRAAAPDERLRPLWASAFMLGLVAGGIVTIRLDLFAKVGPDPRADFIHTIGLSNILTHMAGELPTLLFSTFSAFWLAVLLLRRHWMPDRTTTLVAVGVAVAALAVTATTLDSTRVYSLLTWPLVLWFVRRLVAARADPRVSWVLAVTFIFAVVVPRVIVYDGYSYVSSLSHLTARL